MPRGSGRVDTQGETAAQRLLDEGRTARAKGDASSAKAKLRSAADAARKQGSPRVRALAFEELAQLARAEHDALRGRTHWDAARDAWSEVGDALGVARATEGGAELRADTGERVAAIDLFRRASELFQEGGDAQAARRCRARADELFATSSARLAASAEEKRPSSSPGRTQAFLELLGDATARLADPRGAASEDAILVALKGAIALTGAERGFVASRRAPGAEPTFVVGLDHRGQRLDGANFRPSLTVVRSVLD